MDKLAVEIPYEFDALTLESLFVSAFEGGSNYWVYDANLLESPALLVENLVWWGNKEIWVHPFKVKLVHDDPDRKVPVETIFSEQDLVRALRTMALTTPYHFYGILGDSADSVTGDVLLQLICFNTVVFG